MCSMEELRQQCQSCQLCGLGATRKNLVFGDGNPDADVMFIGEGPGKQEDEQGIPFLLRRWRWQCHHICYYCGRQ